MCSHIYYNVMVIKQTMIVVSLNHSKIPTIHYIYIYISCECIQLRSIVQQIWELCRLSSIKNNWILLYEDNVAYIIQI